MPDGTMQFLTPNESRKKARVASSQKRDREKEAFMANISFTTTRPSRGSLEILFTERSFCDKFAQQKDIADHI